MKALEKKNPEGSWHDVNLLRVADNDFSMPLIDGDGPLNFHLPARKHSKVAELALVRRKNHARERAVAVVLAEIQDSVAPARRVRPQ